MRVLNLKFKTSDNKVRQIALDYVNQELSSEVVERAMQEIADANLFYKEETHLFDKPLSAKYVERIETPIFQAKA